MPDVGRKAEGEKQHTQSVVFTKKLFSEGEAEAWCKEHDYYTDGFDETETSYRYRQYDPDDETFDYRNKKADDGITLVLGILKKKSKQNKPMERRGFGHSEFRVTEEGKISGHAAVFDQVEPDGWGGFEVVRAGAFSKTLQEKPDIKCLWNHNSDALLGRTTNGTLRLWEDKKGLAFECDPPGTTWGRDALTSIKRGDVDQCSFGFTPIKDSWDNEAKLRELLEIQLFEVSPVIFPFYSGTDVDARNLNNILVREGVPQKKITRILRSLDIKDNENKEVEPKEEETSEPEQENHSESINTEEPVGDNHSAEDKKVTPETTNQADQKENQIPPKIETTEQPPEPENPGDDHSEEESAGEPDESEVGKPWLTQLAASKVRLWKSDLDKYL